MCCGSWFASQQLGSCAKTMQDPLSRRKKSKRGSAHPEGPDYLAHYLDEFTFRFNRRASRSRGKLPNRGYCSDQARKPLMLLLKRAAFSREGMTMFWLILIVSGFVEPPRNAANPAIMHVGNFKSIAECEKAAQVATVKLREGTAVPGITFVCVQASDSGAASLQN